MSKIKIGQIGTGHGHAKGKMEVLRTLPDFEVIGVVEPDEHLRQRAQREKAYQGLRWMSEQQLLNTPGLQAVAVETRVADLLDVAERALAADLHIHLDKPAGTSLKQFERLLDTAARKHRLVQMGYMYRYNPAFVMLRKWLADGWLGEPFEVHAVMSKVVSPSKRQRFAIFSGGMMFELGCHLIDLVVGMFGVPDSIRPFVRHVANKGANRIGNAEHADHQVDQMATQLEHHAATENGESLSLARRNNLAHHRVHLEGFAKPTVGQPFAQHYESRIVAIHIAHLHETMFACGRVEQPLKLLQRSAGRLVEMDMQVGRQGPLGYIEQVGNTRFHGYRLKAGRVEQLLLAHPAEPLVRLFPLGPLSQVLVRLDNANHLEVGQRAQDFHFALCVAVAGSDLANFYFAHCDNSRGLD